MKKIKFIATVLFSALIMFCMTLSISAEGVPVYDVENGQVFNKGYYEQLNNYNEKILYEQELVNIYNEQVGTVKTVKVQDKDGKINNYTYTKKLIHIYNIYPQSEYNICNNSVFEFETVHNDGKVYRCFVKGILFFTANVKKYDEIGNELYTVDDLNSFLVENGHKAHFIQGDNETFKLVYDDKTGENVINTFVDVTKRFDIDNGLFAVMEAESEVSYCCNPNFQLTSAVKFQRYLSHSAELDSSELTDFDLNGDGNLNVIDLIMMKRKLTDLNK